jgi:hypothetical protein
MALQKMHAKIFTCLIILSEGDRRQKELFRFSEIQVLIFLEIFDISETYGHDSKPGFHNITPIHYFNK